MLKVPGLNDRPHEEDAALAHHSEGSRPRRMIFLVLLAVLGLLLAWQVIVRSWSATLAEPSPGLALVLNSSQPQALLIAAERRLDEILATARSTYASQERDRLPNFSSRRIVGVPDESALSEFPPGYVLPEDQARNVEDLLRRAIVAEPLNAPAFTLLGRVSELKGDEVGALRHFKQSVLLSRHEVSAAIWLLNHAVRTNDLDLVLVYADLLQRVRPSLVGPIAPILARAVETEAGRPKTVALIASDPSPPWRQGFLQLLPRHVVDPRAPMLVLLGLKQAGRNVEVQELKPYLESLLLNGLPEVAYQTWLQFLTDAQLSTLGRLNNADFETLPSGLPFDWVIRAGTNANAEIRPHPEHPHRKVLTVGFAGGRADFRAGVRQWVVLPPGSYRLWGVVEGELRGRRGLRWRILCQAARTQAQIAESDMLLGKFPEGRSFSVSFTVPRSECPAQIIQLDLDARSSSEQLVLGELLFDDFGLERVDTSEKPVQ